MKRIWIILLAVAVALVIALPASGKPGKGKPDPSMFEATMSLEEGMSGFATTLGCTGTGSITMELSRGNTLMAVDVPILEVSFPDIEWYRYYPYYPDEAAVPDDFDPNDYPRSEPEEGTGLTGCHGAGIDVYVTEDAFSIEQYPGLLMLTVRDGNVDLVWHSDYYREWMPLNKKHWGIAEIEDFSYVNVDALTWTDDGEPDGEPVDWDSTTGGSGIVTGDLAVTHFSPGSYDPFVGSPVNVEFTLTIEPKS